MFLFVLLIHLIILIALVAGSYLLQIQRWEHRPQLLSQTCCKCFHVCHRRVHAYADIVRQTQFCEQLNSYPQLQRSPKHRLSPHRSTPITNPATAPLNPWTTRCTLSPHCMQLYSMDGVHTQYPDDDYQCTLWRLLVPSAANCLLRKNCFSNMVMLGSVWTLMPNLVWMDLIASGSEMPTSIPNCSWCKQSSTCSCICCNYYQCWGICLPKFSTLLLFQHFFSFLLQLIKGDGSRGCWGQGASDPTRGVCH